MNEPGANLRATVLQTSSWAMANCFIIEKVLKQERADWYVDTRIVRKVQGLRTEFQKKKVRMLPTNRERTVFLYKNNQLFSEV